MSTFKVGQRVRAARPINPCNQGATGTIRRMFHEFTVDGVPVNCVCDWDRPVVGYWSHTDMLEPIVPPHEASEYTYHELMDKLRAGEVAPV